MKKIILALIVALILLISLVSLVGCDDTITDPTVETPVTNEDGNHYPPPPPPLPFTP